MARDLSRRYDLAHMDLDQLAWSEPAVRRPLAESAAEIAEFIRTHEEWVAEGCYADLLELLLDSATEVRFLNPGADVCVANCRARPWEPEKYPSKEEQDSNLTFLLGWVRDYASRDDEYSLASHRDLFERFRGPKKEYTEQE